MANNWSNEVEWQIQKRHRAPWCVAKGQKKNTKNKATNPKLQPAGDDKKRGKNKLISWQQ
jgi:hypothetical protein